MHAVAGAKLPPIANDDIAPPPAPGAATVTVDVLRNDDDPTGSPGDLRITSVPAGVTIHGALLTIPVTKLPREVPYPDHRAERADRDRRRRRARQRDLRDQAQARRAYHPQAGQHGQRAARLQTSPTPPGGSCGSPRSTGSSPPRPATSPVDAHQDGAFLVHALGGYTGPGAVSVQVYDGTSLQDPRGNTATVTIPVQVGADVPVLRCPRAALGVIEGLHPADLQHRPALPRLGGHHDRRPRAPLHRRLGQPGQRGQRQRHPPAPACSSARPAALVRGPPGGSASPRPGAAAGVVAVSVMSAPPPVGPRCHRRDLGWPQRHGRPQPVRHQPAAPAEHPGAERHPPHGWRDGHQQRVPRHHHAARAPLTALSPSSRRSPTRPAGRTAGSSSPSPSTWSGRRGRPVSRP